MCLIAFRLDPDGPTPLVLAANRDEYFARPTQDAHWWDDVTRVFGGRDETAGGSWLAASTQGRLAALTNFAGGASAPIDAPSRGAIVRELLADDGDMITLLTRYGEACHAYAGFNLLAFEWQPSAPGSIRAWRLSNRGTDAGTVQDVGAGTHAISNGDFDCPWPKSNRLARRLQDCLAVNAVDPRGLLLSALSETQALVADDDAGSDRQGETRSERSPSAGLASAFVSTELAGGPYGTRSSAVISLQQSGLFTFDEWQWHTDSSHGIAPTVARHRHMSITTTGSDSAA